MVQDDRLLHDTQSMLEILGVDLVLSCRKNEQEPLPNDDAVAADAVDKEIDQAEKSVGDGSSDEEKVEIIIKLEYDVENVSEEKHQHADLEDEELEFSPALQAVSDEVVAADAVDKEMDQTGISVCDVETVTKDTEGTVKFKCPQCDFCGDDGFDLEKHTRGHGGEKPYELATRYTSHDDNHSTQKQVKRRKCIKKKETVKKTTKAKAKDVTRKFSPRSSDRNCHYKGLVKGRECTQEGKDNETTTNGRRMHGCEKPHNCTVCDYSTDFSSDLKRHMMRHTGEKPLKCTVCDYSTVYSSHLKIHMMKHTGEKPYK